MNIEDQLDAQRELYKRQYQDLSERLSGLEALVNDAASLIKSRSSVSELTEVCPGFFLDLSSIQQVSLTESEEELLGLVNWQRVSTETTLSVLIALGKDTSAIRSEIEAYILNHGHEIYDDLETDITEE